MKFCSPFQMTALHSLFRIYAPRCLGQAGVTMERRERLAWASDIVGRSLESFSTLRPDEAARLIDLMKRAIGQDVTPAETRTPYRPGGSPDRDQAQAYGTAGRRDQVTNEIRLVDAPTLELMDRLLAQLGWTRQRLEAFLHSRSSPVPGGAIRTLAEANRIIWALRNMIRKQEKAAYTREKGGTPSKTFSRSNQAAFNFGRLKEGTR